MNDKNFFNSAGDPNLTPEHLRALRQWEYERGRGVAQAFADEEKAMLDTITDVELRKQLSKLLVFNWSAVDDVTPGSSGEFKLYASYTKNMSCGCHPEMETFSEELKDEWLFLDYLGLRDIRRSYINVKMLEVLEERAKEDERKAATARALTEREAELDNEFGSGRIK